MKNPQYAVLGLAVIIFLALATVFWGWPLDDALEENVYAKNLAQGHGFVFNVGGETIEGYACLLWILLLAFWILLGIDVVFASSLMGVTFGVLAIIMLYKLSLLVSGNKKYAIYPSLFLASMPAFAIWATSGVETALFVLLLITALYFFIKEEKQGKGYLSAVFFLLLALTRHEGGIIFLASLVFRGVKHWNEMKDRDYLKKQALWAAIVIVPYALYTVWRLLYFGDLFPNPFYAKSSLASWYGNISSLALVLSYIAPIIIVGIFGIIDKKLSSAQKYLMFIISIMTLIIWRLGGWYWAYRYAVPILPLVLVFSQGGIERLFAAVKKQGKFGRFLAVIVPLILIFYLVYPVMQFNRNIEIGRSVAEGTISHYTEWFNTYYPNITLAFGDIGAMRYYTNLTLIDVAGLNNRYIAHNGFSVDYILKQKPELVMLISQTEKDFTSLNDPRNEYITLYNSQAFHNAYSLVFKSFVFDGYYFWTYARNDFQLSPEALANHP